MNWKDWTRMENRYTQEELERARQYLRERLETEGLAASAISVILEECAETLVDFILGGATDEEMDMAIEGLVDSLMQWIDNLAVGEHDRRDALLLWLHGQWNGGRMEEIVRQRAGTFRDEVAVACAAGELLHRTKADILAAVKASMRDPWKNPMITEVLNEAAKGSIVIPDGIDLEERHYGQGIPVSSLTALEFLGESAVADSWTWWQHEDEKSRGSVGYFVERGSSYPCEECDSHTGIFYKIDDTEHLPQYHRSCRCFVVYSYVERL